MASKREEVKAFNRLRKLFPNRDVGLEVRYSSWRDLPNYSAYISVGDGKRAVSVVGDTPKEAVDYAIEEEKGGNKEQKARKDEQLTP